MIDRKRDTLASPAYPPPVFVTSEMPAIGETGVQTHFNDFVAHLRSRHRAVEFVGPDESRRAYPHLRITNGVFGRIIPLHREAGYAALRQMTLYSTRSELRKRVRGMHEWCVYAQDPVTARAALDLRTNSSQRVVLAIHYNVSQAEEMARRGNLRPNGMLYKSIQREEKFVIQHVDAAVAFSRFMRDSLGLQEDLLKKVVVVPNTCMHPPSSGAAERDLIAVGSLEPRKNQSFLLEVVAEAKRLGYRYSLSLVGSGESRSDLERMAARLQISDQIYFLGRVRNASSLLCSHKLLVHSAVIENMPIALIEALASGTPILAPAVGGIPEILRDGVEGYLWNLADVAGSARLLVRLMNDGELRKQMSVAAKQRYLDDFAPGKVFASIEKLIYGNLF